MVFLQFLESDPFKCKIHKDSNYFYFIDDLLLAYPWNNDLTKITDRLNNIELENYNNLPFLDILLIDYNKLECKVYIINPRIKLTIHVFTHCITQK